MLGFFFFLHHTAVLEPPRLWDGGTETFRLWLVGEKRKRGGGGKGGGGENPVRLEETEPHLLK